MDQPQKFLESKDLDFDVTRAFLVLSMVTAHVFEMFYAPDFNRHYVYYILVGFVLLSGFTVSVRYGEKVITDPMKYLSTYLQRFLKIFGLFLICNLCIMGLFPARFQPLTNLGFLSIISAIILGSRQAIFGFDVLIPIAFTILLSWFLLVIRSSKWAIPAVIVFLTLLLFVEKFNVAVLNSYGIKLTFAGLIGTILGKVVGGLDWGNLTRKLQKSLALILLAAGLFLYYFGLAVLTKKGSLMILSIHVIPSIVILLFIYLASKRAGFGSITPVQMISSLLSKHMLFAYLFHILVINILFSVIDEDSLDFFSSLLLSAGVLSATIAMCHAIEIVNKRSLFAFRAYSIFFK